MDTTTSGQVVKFLRLSIHKHIARLRLRGIDRSRMKIRILLPMVLILLGGAVQISDEDLYPRTTDGQLITNLSTAESVDVRQHIEEFQANAINWPTADLVESSNQDFALRTLMVLNDRVTELTNSNQRDRERILVPFFLLAGSPDEEVGEFDDEVYPKRASQPIRCLTDADREQALTLFQKEWEEAENEYGKETCKVESNVQKIEQVVAQLRTSIKRNADLRSPQGFEKMHTMISVLLPTALVLLPNSEMEVLKSEGADQMYPTDAEGRQIRTLPERDVNDLRPHIQEYEANVSAGDPWPTTDLIENLPASSALRVLLTLAERVNRLTDGEDAARRRQELLIPFFLLSALPDQLAENFPDDLFPKDPLANNAPIRALSATEKRISHGIFEKYWNTYRIIYNEQAVKETARARLRERVH